MRKNSIVMFVTLLYGALAPFPSRADCVEEPRKVSFDAENVVRLKSYKCRSGADTGVAVRVEFHRLSPSAAGLLLAGGASAKLKQTIGSPTLIDNDVWRTYAELTAKFGEVETVPKRSAGSEGSLLTISAPKSPTALNAPPAATAYAGDVISLKKFRHTDPYAGFGAYPAADEITELLKKHIPKNLTYGFSTISCDPKSDTFCLKMHKDAIELVFWRSLNAADIENYAYNTGNYNTNLMKIRKNAKLAKEDSIATEPPNSLKALQYIAGKDWPEDFVVMTGDYTPQAQESCGDGPKTKDLVGMNGWSFSFQGRTIEVEVMLVENASSLPIVLDSLTGHRNATTKLRAIDERGIGDESAAFEKLSVTLAPGARALIPTRIVLTTPGVIDDEDANKYRGGGEAELRAALAAHLTAKGFASPQADQFKRIPVARDYAYGPELSVAGLVVNSKPLAFSTRHSANSIDLTVAAEVGSCPHLLTWDNTERNWAREGKILHDARNAEHAYSETRRIEGLKTRFRIEEREPEIAHLADARLTLILDNGARLSLKPAGAAARGVDLQWGAGFTFEFEAPPNLETRRVSASELTVEGYYERYTGIGANEPSERSSRERAVDPMCVAPNSSVRSTPQ